MTTISLAIKNFIEKIENTQISFWRGAFLLFGIIFIRTFLENYTNSLNLYHLSSVGDTFFHYPVFYLIIFLSCFIIARILTKEEITKIAKVVTMFSFVVITPPVVDLIINQGGQIPYIFISGSYSEIFKSFITYFGGGAIGIGIKTEVALVLSGFGLYIFYKTKKTGRALIGIFFLYLTIFATLASPALIFGLQNSITNQYQTISKNSIIDFYYHQEPLNSVTDNRTFVTDNNNILSPLVQKISNQYSITLAIIFLITSVILLSWCLFLYSSKKFFAVIKNFRYLRIMHYMLMLSIGVGIGVTVLGKNPVGSLFDLVSFISLALALIFAWLFSVWENDEVDIETDKISNQERPLVKVASTITLLEWQNIKNIFLAYSLGFAFLSGWYSFVFILLFIFLYHIYSTPPFRLKRFLGISSLIIAINALLAVFMGFFISAGTENFNSFPAKYIFGIIGIFLLVENVKNIKDIDGDRKEGIKTIPVIFGEKKGKLIIGGCLFLATLLIPLIFYLNLYTLGVSIFFGSILFFITNKKNFKENYIFLTYFLYAMVFFILINL